MDQIMSLLEIIFNSLQDDDHVNLNLINSNFRTIAELIVQTNFDKVQSARISSAFQLLDDIDVRFRLMSITHQNVAITRGLLLKIKQLHLA